MIYALKYLNYSYYPGVDIVIDILELVGFYVRENPKNYYLYVWKN